MRCRFFVGFVGAAQLRWLMRPQPSSGQTCVHGRVYLMLSVARLKKWNYTFLLPVCVTKFCLLEKVRSHHNWLVSRQHTAFSACTDSVNGVQHAISSCSCLLCAKLAYQPVDWVRLKIITACTAVFCSNLHSLYSQRG